MPTYQYQSVNSNSELARGEMQAESRNEVILHLQKNGHIPIEVIEKSTQKRKIFSFRDLRLKNKIRHKDIILFTRELVVLIDAGLPLDHALEIVKNLSSKPAMQEMIVNIRQRVKRGENFSTALEAQGEVFSALYLNMIRAGEAGGAMETVLHRLADHLERTEKLRTDIITALLYPGILLFVSILSIVILMGIVVPRFVPLFADMGQALPFSTQVIFTLSQGVKNYAWLIFLLLAGGIWWGKRKLQDPEKRLLCDHYLLQLPLYGELLIKIEVARFAETLATLLTHGVNLLQASRIVCDGVHNRILAKDITNATENLAAGKELSAQLAQSKYFPELALQLLQTGEQTGAMEPMLEKIALIYEREVRDTIKKLLTLLEPVLILGLGVVIAIIILSILSAVLSINELIV